MPIPTQFFEKQGEHIFPMIARLVLTDTKAFANKNEKSTPPIVAYFI
jgi:hypothetical protein